MTDIPAWSFSRLKTFETCPKQYYHVKVAKDYEEDWDTDAIRFGNEMHKAAELYIADDEPLPPPHRHLRKMLDRLKAMPGEKHCEMKLAVNRSLEPCGFFDDNCFFRCIIDFASIDFDAQTAYVVDYKTGKSTRYADKEQLELCALALFSYFPSIERIKGGLLFTVARAFLTDTYSLDNETKLWQKWLARNRARENAYKMDTWNPRPSGLCKKHCVVLECPHNGRN